MMYNADNRNDPNFTHFLYCFFTRTSGYKKFGKITQDSGGNHISVISELLTGARKIVDVDNSPTAELICKLRHFVSLIRMKELCIAGPIFSLSRKILSITPPLLPAVSSIT